MVIAPRAVLEKTENAIIAHAARAHIARALILHVNLVRLLSHQGGLTQEESSWLSGGANITSENYQAFRRVLKDAPATFQEHLSLRLKPEPQTINYDDEIRHVEIDLTEFAEFCAETNSVNDFRTLDSFALEVGGREKDRVAALSIACCGVGFGAQTYANRYLIGH